jgi:hypothetical protein
MHDWVTQKNHHLKFVSVTLCLFVCLFGGVSKAGGIRTLPKTSLPVAVLRVAKGQIP